MVMIIIRVKTWEGQGVEVLVCASALIAMRKFVMLVGVVSAFGLGILVKLSSINRIVADNAVGLVMCLRSKWNINIITALR